MESVTIVKFLKKKLESWKVGKLEFWFGMEWSNVKSDVVELSSLIELNLLVLV